MFYAARYRFSNDDDATPTEMLIIGPEALLAFIFVVNEELPEAREGREASTIESASELVRRNMRDLDDGGRLLWIGKTKTAAGRRRLLIPDELAPYLVAIAAGRPGDAPLFVSEASRRWRNLSTILRHEYTLV